MLQGHIALAILSLPETDPQILENWGLRWWGSPGQIIPGDGFWSRMLAWRTTALVNWTHRVGFSVFELFRKIFVDFESSISWNTQDNCRVIFNMATALLSPFFWYLLLGCPSTWRCAQEHFPQSASIFGLVEQAFWRMPLFTEWSGASSFEVILERQLSFCCVEDLGEGFGRVDFARFFHIVSGNCNCRLSNTAR